MSAQSSFGTETILFEDLFRAPPRNGIYKPKQYMGQGVPMVKMTELFKYERIRAARLSFDLIELTEKEKDRLLLQDDDLLFSRTSVVADGVGKCSIVQVGSQELTFDSNTIRIRLDQNCAFPMFYFYYFKSPVGRAKVLSRASGAAVTTVSGSKIASLRVPHPPLPTQRKIAAVLSAYDDLIENNTRRIAVLEEMAQVLYREWFVHFRFPGHEDVPLVDSPLGLIPEEWEVKRLEDVCDLVIGQSPKSEFYNEDGDGLPFHQGVSDFGDLFPVTRRYCTVTKRVAEPGDILFSVRAPVGRMNIADRKIVIGRGLHAIRSRMGSQTFIFRQLKEKFYEEDIMGGGTIFKSVTKSDMLGLEFLMPSPSLLAQFDKIVPPMLAAMKNLTTKNATLRRTRDLLLPRLIPGQLDVSGLPIEAGEADGGGRSPS